MPADAIIPSTGMLHTLSDDAVAKAVATKKYMTKLNTDAGRKELIIAWRRIVCCDPDALGGDRLELSLDTVQAINVAHSIQGGGGAAGAAGVALDASTLTALQRAPLNQMLKAAAKESWSDICASSQSINSFLCERMLCKNPDVILVRDFLSESWELMNTVILPKSLSASTAAAQAKLTAERLYNGMKLSSMFLDFIKYHERLCSKNQLYPWQLEVFNTVIAPATNAFSSYTDENFKDSTRNIEHKNMLSDIGKLKDKVADVTTAHNNLKRKVDEGSANRNVPNNHDNTSIKKARVEPDMLKKYEGLFLEAAKKSRREKSSRPYGTQFLDDVIEKAKTVSESDFSAAKVCRRMFCRNCLLHGFAEKHVHQACGKEWLLACPKCGEAHKGKDCPN